MMRAEKKVLILVILISVIAFFISFYLESLGTDLFLKKREVTSLQKIGITHRLEREGRALVRQGKYGDAERKFIEANDPKFWLAEDRPNGVADGWLRDLYGFQGRYQESLRLLQKFLKSDPDYEPYLDEQLKYQALINARDEANAHSVYQYIAKLKMSKAKYLPPGGYDPLASLRPISNILRLYNVIGDHDAGIRFINEILAYFRTGKAGDPKPGRVDAEYMKVREAFEQDKAEGFKGCLQAKEGEVCMGRATKALIDSDYFPW